MKRNLTAKRAARWMLPVKTTNLLHLLTCSQPSTPLACLHASHRCLCRPLLRVSVQLSPRNHLAKSLNLIKGFPAQLGRSRCKRALRAADALWANRAHLWALLLPGPSQGREEASVCQAVAGGGSASTSLLV